MLVIKLRDFFVIAIEHICDAILCFTLIEKLSRPRRLSTKATEGDLYITPDRRKTLVFFSEKPRDLLVEGGPQGAGAATSAQ